MRQNSPTRAKLQTQLALRQAAYDSSAGALQRQEAKDSETYYHYNNAVYMGGMVAYQKQGKGILLHDDGSAVICEHTRDRPSGHNIYFRENSLLSAVYTSPHESELVYKSSQSILRLPLQSHLPHGDGLLVDYFERKLYLLSYRKGLLKSKVLLLDEKDNQDVFLNNKLTRLIGPKHEAALNFTFKRPEAVHVRYDKQEVSVGYSHANGETRGLAFKMFLSDHADDHSKPFFLKAIERGVYRDSKLEGFGEYYFSNGNRYIGEFKQGVFDGLGILLAPTKFKWIFGQFESGKLLSILEQNNTTEPVDAHFRVWTHCLKEIHSSVRSRWIDQDIDVIPEKDIYSLLKQAIDTPYSEVQPDRQHVKHQKELTLSKIQEQFTAGNPSRSTVSSRLAASEFDSKAQSIYRREDPFKIELLEVPVDSRYSERKPQSFPQINAPKTKTSAGPNQSHTRPAPRAQIDPIQLSAEESDRLRGQRQEIDRLQKKLAEYDQEHSKYVRPLLKRSPSKREPDMQRQSLPREPLPLSREPLRQPLPLSREPLRQPLRQPLPAQQQVIARQAIAGQASIQTESGGRRFPRLLRPSQIVPSYKYSSYQPDYELAQSRSRSKSKSPENRINQRVFNYNVPVEKSYQDYSSSQLPSRLHSLYSDLNRSKDKYSRLQSSKEKVESYSRSHYPTPESLISAGITEPRTVYKIRTSPPKNEKAQPISRDFIRDNYKSWNYK